MKKLNKNKKAMEMSINIIIMLVIGLTIMGLIIGFVTSFLGKAQGSFTGKLSQDDKTKIEQVKRKPDNFVFLTSTVEVQQGSKTPGKLYVKIRNPTDTDFNFEGTNGEITSGTSPFTVEITKGRVEDSSGSPDGITIYSPPILLTKGQSDGFPLEVYADSTVSLGTYYGKFTVEEGTDSYNAIVTIKVI